MKNRHRIIMLNVAIVLSIFAALSCSKSSETVLPPPPATFFRFSANGTVYHWDGVPGFFGSTCFFCGSDITKKNGYYILRSSDPRNYSNVLTLNIPASILSVTTYTLTTVNSTTAQNADHKIYIDQPSSPVPPLSAAATEPGDYATITITSIHDGIYADGIFSARITLTPYGSLANKLDITGEFQNVKII